MNDKLTSCDDCGGKVSKRAATCPHCGAPQELIDEIAGENEEDQDAIDRRRHDEVEQMQKSTAQYPHSRTAVSAHSGNLITCRVCGEKRSGRNWDSKTVCQSCGDVRQSIGSISVQVMFGLLFLLLVISLR
jgi:ribosomal protein L37E